MATTLGIVTPDNTAPTSGGAGSSAGGSMPTSGQGLQPNINSGNTNTTGSISSLSKDDVSQVMFDLLKNTSINGVYPTVSGGNMDYSLSTGPKASDEWAKQNWQSPPTYNDTPALIGQAINKSDIVSGDSGQNPQNSNVDVAKSSSTVANNNVDIAKSSSTVANNNVDVAKSSSTVVNSNVDIAKSGSSSVSDSKVAASTARLPVLSDADLDVADPESNEMSRRAGNERASSMVGQTPLLVFSADKQSAMVLYVQDSNTISVDPDPEDRYPEEIRDSLSGETITEDDYFVSGIPIDFYCLKGDESGYITLSAMTKFKKLEE